MTTQIQFVNDRKLKLRSVCVSCGQLKKRALEPCPACNYAPSRDYEIARALLLSEVFTINEDVQLGMPYERLEEISRDIQSGRPYPFNHQDQEKVLYEYRRFIRSNSEAQYEFNCKKVVIMSIVVSVLAGLVLYFVFFN